MTTRSSANWLAKPGGFDALHCSLLFPSASSYGIPRLETQDCALPDDFRLLPYRSRLDRLDLRRDICHCFLDDYRFESTWNQPEVGLRHVSGYFAACSPDFSLYPSWPRAAQIWNTYRSRWVARFWQERGIKVIPTVNWSDAQSFEFCFDGLRERSILAISTADCRRPHVERRFAAGLQAMLERCRPATLIVYGRLKCRHRDACDAAGCRVIEVAPAWERLREIA
ncbi:hypothetical protein CKO31_22985 [Thiohalocapsa halophila]|uniref:DUF4417 domain-containing protein n=1 Tax=Thiohalocapsa halophila TaxID=69359 RepID=A0ABS1CNN6_9GAMM|nr:DUF4417 domain-containing protein [Thiohalocapsa halophila]MBK1633557.1 hypothetical protein [Thiohalocapsa halophila]